MNELFRRTEPDADGRGAFRDRLHGGEIGFQIAVYTGPDGEPAAERVLTLDTIYPSVEEAIANEDAARSDAFTRCAWIGRQLERTVLVVERVENVVWL